MSWHELAFLHWPVSPHALRAVLPKTLTLDMFDGVAWLGVVPFWMSGVRPRLTPPLPGLATFAELNVRTYVVAGDKPGVWFFSLDAASRIAVRGARTLFHLPYFDARMSVSQEGGAVRYRSERTHRGAIEVSARRAAILSSAGSPSAIASTRRTGKGVSSGARSTTGCGLSTKRKRRSSIWT
jgi:uncharacterized protein